MSRLDLEARMTIRTLAGRTTKSEIARLLRVTEGAVRYHVGRMEIGAVDGRSRQTFKAQALAEAIDVWRSQQTGSLNLSLLHDRANVSHGLEAVVGILPVSRHSRRTLRSPVQTVWPAPEGDRVGQPQRAQLGRYASPTQAPASVARLVFSGEPGLYVLAERIALGPLCTDQCGCSGFCANRR
jgi:DNA-binding CsgD family transcriptional regulator